MSAPVAPLKEAKPEEPSRGGGLPTPESPIPPSLLCPHRTFLASLVLASTFLDRIGTTLTGLVQSFLVSALARLANGRGLSAMLRNGDFGSENSPGSHRSNLRVTPIRRLVRHVPAEPSVGRLEGVELSLRLGRSVQMPKHSP